MIRLKGFNYCEYVYTDSTVCTDLPEYFYYDVKYTNHFAGACEIHKYEYDRSPYWIRASDELIFIHNLMKE